MCLKIPNETEIRQSMRELIRGCMDRLTLLVAICEIHKSSLKCIIDKRDVFIISNYDKKYLSMVESIILPRLSLKQLVLLNINLSGLCTLSHFDMTINCDGYTVIEIEGKYDYEK